MADKVWVVTRSAEYEGISRVWVCATRNAAARVIRRERKEGYRDTFVNYSGQIKFVWFYNVTEKEVEV